MKKVVSLILGLTLLVGMLGACASGTDKSGKTATASNETVEESTTTESPGGEKVAIQFWHHHSGGTAENLGSMINKYNELPDGKATVTLQYLPKNELLKRYALGVISGDLPEVALTDNADTLSFAAMGMYVDITNRVNLLEHPDFLPQALNSGNYNGKQYSVPIRSNCLALWVNNGMMTEAGVTEIPVTWEELLEVCKTLKEKNPNVYPLALSAVKTEDIVFQFLPFLFSAGANWDTMDSPEAIEALDFVKTLSDNGYISMEVINWSQNDVEKQFAAGNSTMMINGSWQLPNIKNDAPDLNYSIIKIPMNKEYASTLGGENIGMTIASEGKEDAVWDFMSWMESLDSSLEYNTLCGTISPNIAITKEMQYPDDEVMSAFIDQAQYAVARGPHPKWPEISGILQECIQETLTGTKTTKEAAKNAAEKIAAITG